MNERKELPNGDDRLVCLECMQGVVVGGDCKDEQEMREFLATKGIEIPVKATYMEVLSIFEDAESGMYGHFDDDIEKVKFPRLQTGALHPSQPDFDRIKTVLVQDLCDLITDEDIPLEAAVGLVHILASLTDVNPREKGEKMSYKCVLPSNIIEMANNSRVHTGERLCERGLRHALDKGTPDILCGKITLAKQNETLCIIIENEILASMKKIKYFGSTAFSLEELLATSCHCRAGCTNKSATKLGESRVACTHSFARMVQASQLLYRQSGAMTRLVLVSLRSRIRKEGADIELDADLMQHLKDDIILLIKATGKCPPVLTASTSVLGLLNEFAASTDTAKLSPGEAKLRDLGLLRDKVSYDSPMAKAEKLIKGEGYGCRFCLEL